MLLLGFKGEAKVIQPIAQASCQVLVKAMDRLRQLALQISVNAAYNNYAASQSRKSGVKYVKTSVQPVVRQDASVRKATRMMRGATCRLGEGTLGSRMPLSSGHTRLLGHQPRSLRTLRRPGYMRTISLAICHPVLLDSAYLIGSQRMIRAQVSRFGDDVRIRHRRLDHQNVRPLVCVSYLCKPHTQLRRSIRTCGPQAHQSSLC
jgi:hypothetical protein